MNAWCFVGPSDFGLGLFARTALAPGQAISEYSGPRLPGRRAKIGDSVLQVPGTDVVIDGKGENSPQAFPYPRTPAVFANHSTRPNAHLEVWPLPRPGACDLRQQLLLVCTEAIAPGREIRIDYEDGAPTAGMYWGAEPPRETRWRQAHVQPPPPAADAEPVCHRLQELQAAAAAGKPAPWCPQVEPPPAPVAWDGPAGGDERMRQAMPLIAGPRCARPNWSILATHVPGRSGRECRDRWKLMHEREDTD